MSNEKLNRDPRRLQIERAKLQALSPRIGSTRNRRSGGVGVRVLLLEDGSPEDRRLTSLLADTGPHGYHVASCARLTDGQQRFRDESFDVVLVDLGGPDAFDLGTVREVLGWSPDLPVLVLSDGTDTSLASEAVELGALDYLIKEDVTLAQLDRTLRGAIDRGENRRREGVHGQPRYRATHDPLTGLPNRVLFYDLLEHSLHRAERYDGELAVLFINLDRFKQINDGLGHRAGDEVLIAVAERISSAVRKSDTVARLGGDEFTIALQDVRSPLDVQRVAQTIQRRLADPIRLQGREVIVHGSLGLAHYPTDGRAAEELIGKANRAMHFAKERCPGSSRHYSAEMHGQAPDGLLLEHSLREAVQAEQIEVFYQPEIDIETSRIVAVEALSRWRHPELGLVPPNRFIPVAEASGLIEPLTNQVLGRACRQLREWWELGLEGLRVAVNFSPRLFRAISPCDAVARALAASGVEPASLELEFTESCFILQPGVTIESLHAMKRQGVRLSIDDFGTGYSSLAMLQQIPADSLKIDRGFIQNAPAGSRGATITSAIIALARSMGIDAVAEGVETAEQRSFLEQRQCRLMQGFLFSHPLPPAEMTRLLLETRGRLG